MHLNQVRPLTDKLPQESLLAHVLWGIRLFHRQGDCGMWRSACALSSSSSGYRYADWVGINICHLCSPFVFCAVSIFLMGRWGECWGDEDDESSHEHSAECSADCNAAATEMQLCNELQPHTTTNSMDRQITHLGHNSFPCFVSWLGRRCVPHFALCVVVCRLFDISFVWLSGRSGK